MQHFARRPAAILLLIALATFLLLRGIVPALSKIQSDFPDYLTAAKIVADGGEVGRLYDNVWFQDQMRRYGTSGPAPGKFAPFPPPTALLLLPLVRLAPLDALRVTTGVSILCLAAAMVLLARILAWSLLDSAIFVLLSGYGLINALRFGQPYVLVSLSCIAGYYAYLRGSSPGACSIPRYSYCSRAMASSTRCASANRTSSSPSLASRATTPICAAGEPGPGRASDCSRPSSTTQSFSCFTLPAAPNGGWCSPARS